MKIYKVKVNGKLYEVELESVTESTQTITAPVQEKPKAEVQSAGASVLAPMQGTILKAHVTPGTKVKKGTLLFILEAMKLENEILSPSDGTIKQVMVAVGQKVDVNQILLIVG